METRKRKTKKERKGNKKLKRIIKNKEPNQSDGEANEN